jgi:acetyltransferase-like isoleucine patch superfamily enzyme
MLEVIKKIWVRFWMRFATQGRFGPMAAHLATLFVAPYKTRYFLAKLYPHGYIAPDASVCRKRLELGRHVYIGGRVIIYSRQDAGQVRIEDDVVINDGSIIEAGDGGGLTIGKGTNIQPRCQFSAYKGYIRIGREVQIAPNCAFYPYDHSIAAGKRIKDQPLSTKGGIAIGDDAWIGYGAVILDGVNIGKGAVVGAGSVVRSNIPDGAIAAGVPARVIRMRTEPGIAVSEFSDDKSVTN